MPVKYSLKLKYGVSRKSLIYYLPILLLFLMAINKISENFLVILGQSKISLETRIVLVTKKYSLNLEVELIGH